MVNNIEYFKLFARISNDCLKSEPIKIGTKLNPAKIGTCSIFGSLLFIQPIPNFVRFPFPFIFYIFFSNLNSRHRFARVNDVTLAGENSFGKNEDASNQGVV